MDKSEENSGAAHGDTHGGSGGGGSGERKQGTAFAIEEDTCRLFLSVPSFSPLGLRLRLRTKPTSRGYLTDTELSGGHPVLENCSFLSNRIGY